MGKIVKLKNKKTGVRVYPVTATSAVVDANSGERLNDTLQNKVEEAPVDGNQYVRINGTWGVAQVATSTKEKCIIKLASNQGESDAASIYGATVKITNVDSAEVYYEGAWDGNPVELEFAAGINYKISVGSVTNYSTPEEKILTALESNIRNINMTYNTEIVSVMLSTFDGESVEGQKITINGVIQDFDGTSAVEQKVAYGTEYSVFADEKNGYYSPTYIFTAGQIARNVELVYKKLTITTIRINQGISDPSTMITRIVDNGGIEAIRENSHRYTGKIVNGKMSLKQLDDTDGTKYSDGTSATLTTVGTDVWMKLPQFWYKCTQHNTDKWDFSVVYGEQPDNSYKEWDGKDLIGVYEAYSSSEKLYSISGVASVDSLTKKTVKNYATYRGDGFSLVKWKHHCMMAMLFYTQYGHTNSQEMIGAGESSYSKDTGVTDSLGMEDTVAGGNGDSNSINFWGLENWWGNKEEYIDNVSANDGIFTIIEDDGTTRNITLQGGGEDYITKMVFGENIDLVPILLSSSATTGFCDQSYYSLSGSDLVISRSGSWNYNECGVAYLIMVDNKYPGITESTRLAFRGEYVIE